MIVNNYKLTLCNPLNCTTRRIQIQAASFSDAEKEAKLIITKDEYLKSIEILDF